MKRINNWRFVLVTLILTLGFWSATEVLPQEQQVTLTLFVHRGSSPARLGPTFPAGARVTGRDGDNNYFDETTNANGYVTITGVPGTWHFTAFAPPSQDLSVPGGLSFRERYQVKTWSQTIVKTGEKHAYLMLAQCDPSHEPISMIAAARYALDAKFKDKDAETIVAIAWAESGGNPFDCLYDLPSNKIPSGSWDRGILQLNDFYEWKEEVMEGTGKGYDDVCAFDPACAFKAAHSVNEKWEKWGRKWEAWVTYYRPCADGSSGEDPCYTKYLTQAHQAVLKAEPQPREITSYLYPEYNVVFSSVPFYLSQLRAAGCGDVWIWDWNREEWVTDFYYVPDGNYYWIYSSRSCTVRLKGTPYPEQQKWLLSRQWQYLTSTKSWNQIGGGCRLINGPWLLQRAYWDWAIGNWKYDWRILDPSEKMDGFHPYWVIVDSSCSINALSYFPKAGSRSKDSISSQPPPITPPGPGPGLEVPAPPSNLRASATSTSQINLNWQDNSDNEEGFKIERKIERGSYSQIATVSSSTENYSDSGLSAGATYCYRVIAYNSAGDSSSSNEACATTEALPPPGNPPRADFTFSPTQPDVGDLVYFTDQSTDPDNDITSWSWNFGDGITSSERNPSHSYSQARVYTVSLSVRDSKGNDDTMSRSVTVREITCTLTLKVEPSERGADVLVEVNGKEPDSYPATYAFDQGTVVTLHLVIAAPDLEFTGWAGDVTVDPTDPNKATVQMDGDKTVIANFQEQPPPPSPGGKSIEEALDLNQNYLIDDDEILRAVQYWIQGIPVPGTSGKVIDDAKMLELINMWISGAPRPPSSTEAEFKETNLVLEGVDLSSNPVRSSSVRFRAEGDSIAEIKVQIYNLASYPVYESDFIPGNTLEWRLSTNNCQIVANGVYLYVITVRGYDNEVIRSQVKKLVVLR